MESAAFCLVNYYVMCGILITYKCESLNIITDEKAGASCIGSFHVRDEYNLTLDIEVMKYYKTNYNIVTV